MFRMTGFGDRIKRAFKALSGGASTVLGSLLKASSPMADRLLADALRFAELPSPTKGEEQRSAFIVERLSSLGIQPVLDGEGNVIAKVSCVDSEHPEPVLVFTELATARWHPLGSLAGVDDLHARGSGLADAFGPAALLALAEAAQAGSVQKGVQRGADPLGALSCSKRELVLLFAARSLTDPDCGVLQRMAADSRNRPAVALGVRGLGLGSYTDRAPGSYLLQIILRTESSAKGEGAAAQASALDTAVQLARNLSGLRWDAEGHTSCLVRRIEAGKGFGHSPTEGRLEIEILSDDRAVLEIAMKAVRATAEAIAKEGRASCELRTAGYLPVQDGSRNRPLSQLAAAILKEQHLRQGPVFAADAAAVLNAAGIPAISVGIVEGREGLETDEISLDSVERGRKFLQVLLGRLSEGLYP